VNARETKNLPGRKSDVRELSNDEIVSHSANIHTIPSTPEIKKQLGGLREGDSGRREVD
jgi:hypothetical protein